MNTRWLINLYPARWRRRYGDEFAELLASQRVGPGMLIDILAGAVDARLRPQAPPPAARYEGEEPMTTNLLKRCAAGGPALTRRDQGIGTAVMLGATLVLSVLYVAAAAARYRGNELVDAFGIMVFPFSLTLALPFTYLKHQSWPARLVIMIMTLALLALASYVAALI